MAGADGDELSVIPIERIIRDVRACVDANISVAGLALALTIPDILGARHYPGLTFENGDRRVHAQYEAWYDSWVAKRFVDRLNWFDGDMCYELRCTLLHSGRADIDYRHREERSKEYRYSFALVDDGMQGHEEAFDRVTGIQTCSVRINADMLAAAICDAAEESEGLVSGGGR